MTYIGRAIAYLLGAMIRRIGLIDIYGLIIGAVLIFITDSFAGDPGVGWHLQTGKYITENLSVPDHDPFLFRTSGLNWISNQWLSDLIFWNIFRIGKWPALHIALTGCILALYVFILFPTLRKISENRLALFLIIFLSAILGSVQWVLRPVVFSFFFFTFVVCQVHAWHHSTQEMERKTSHRLFLVFPFLFVLWANLHPGFPLGLAVILVSLAVLPFEKRRSISERKKRMATAILLLLLSSLATVINPYGLALHQNILGLIGDSYFMNLNIEWQSIDFYLLTFVPFLIALVFMLLLGSKRGGRELGNFECVLLLLFCYISICQRRYIPFFGVVIAIPLASLIPARTMSITGPPIAQALNRISAKDQKASTGQYTVIFWGLIALATVFKGEIPFREGQNLGPKSQYPQQAVQELRLSGINGRIFHTPDWGGYLTWELWPQWQGFVDDRNELNGKEVYEQYFTVMIGKRGWQEILRQYDFYWLFAPPHVPVSRLLIRDPAWEIFFQDKEVILFRRADYSVRPAKVLP